MQTPPAPAPLFFSGRADNACTNLLGFFVRYVRTRGMAEIVESAKLTTFILPFAARTCHALLLATNSCTREELSKRGELTNARSALVGVAETGVNALFDDFCRAFGHSKAREREKYPSGDHRSPIK